MEAAGADVVLLGQPAALRDAITLRETTAPARRATVSARAYAEGTLSSDAALADDDRFIAFLVGEPASAPQRLRRRYDG